MPAQSEREVVLLDREPFAFRYEHALPNPETDRRDLYVPCIANHDACPACEVDKNDAAYVLFLSVLDLEPWTTKGGKEVPYSRRLYVVKARQQSKFTRKFDSYATDGRNLRGLVLKLYRDDDRSSVIGNDIEFTDERLSEADLETYIEEYTDRKNKHHVNRLGNPFDYAELFPAMSREEIAAICGGNAAPVPGSQAEAAQAAQTADAVEGWDDDKSADVPWDEQKPAGRRAGGSTAARRPASQNPRQAASRASAPPRRRVVRRTN